jgi:acetyl esterase/lipase
MSQVCYAIACRTVLVQTRRTIPQQSKASLGDWLTVVGRRINTLARLQRLRPLCGLHLRRTYLDHVVVETICPIGSPRRALADGAIFYLHGGGFFCGSLDTHLHVAANLARRTGLPVVHVEYRQYSDATIEESIGDCVRAYRWLLGQGADPARTVLAGDSAGGFLAFATVLAAQQQGLGTPAGVIGISPLLELDSEQRIAHANASRDPMGVGLCMPMLIECLCPTKLDVNGISPLNGNLDDFPPTLIIAAESEALLCDAERMYEALTKVGRSCTLRVWPSQLHVFPVMLPFLPESRAALDSIVEFIHGCLPEPGRIAA